MEYDYTNYDLDPRIKWEFLKYKICSFTINYCKQKSKAFKNDRTTLEEKVKTLEETLQKDSSSSVIQEYKDSKDKLEECYSKITEGIIVRSRVNWYEYGERNSKYFLNLEKSNKNKSHIKKLLVNSQNITGRKEILTELRNFYSKRFERKCNNSYSDCLYYLRDIATNSLSQEEADLCDGLITASEVQNALSSMASNKTPGNDGLTKEFYSTFLPELITEMVQCYNYSYENGELTPSQRQAVITLIQKSGKDNRYINSWRPISLINTDTKIISKILVSRIKLILSKLIHTDQTAFVPGRYIGEPIRLISDVLSFTDYNKIKGIIFGADFEAAFDSVDFTFIFAVLNKFGFNEQFINWVKILHNNLESCIINNGYSTGYFSLNRGTRQGDPLAPYIFILVMEILANKVRNNKNIKGINISSNKEVKKALFADDATFFLNDISSFEVLLSVIKEFKIFHNET